MTVDKTRSYLQAELEDNAPLASLSRRLLAPANPTNPVARLQNPSPNVSDRVPDNVDPSKASRVAQTTPVLLRRSERIRKLNESKNLSR